ncbi:transporter substrate-binding domain-containing protein [Marinobacteraceae bacterium S3BR75-40.1]
MTMLSRIVAACIAIVLWWGGTVAAAPPLRIVTESWPPYVYASDGHLKGVDWEVVQAVFQQMDQPVELVFCPWKRCLFMIQEKRADAILDVSHTPAREDFMTFPETPISQAPTTFFYRKGTPPPQSLTDVQGRKVGTMAGYEYCPAIDSAGVIREDNKSLESNFKKLMLGRVSLVIANTVVGTHTLEEMGLRDDIAVTWHLLLCHGEANYLAFSRKPELEPLARRFSEALRHFKTTPQYDALLDRYGLNAEAIADHGAGVDRPAPADKPAASPPPG